MSISEIRNPDLFQSLCQQLLVAEYPDTQIVDDSSGDRGIDAYVRSTRTLYAMYCPEKTPTSEKYYRDKIRDDIKKAVTLRDKLGYDISHWIFLTPTPTPESVQRYITEQAQQRGFVSGANQSEKHLTNLLAKHRHVRSVFSQLLTPDLERQLEEIHKSLSSQIREQQVQSPTLEIQFADLTRRKSEGRIADVESEIIELPPESDFPLNRRNFDFRSNEEYWWEKAVFLRESSFIHELGLMVKNSSPTAAKNVKAEITINKVDSAKVLSSFNYPRQPQTHFGFELSDLSRLAVGGNSKSVDVDDFGDRWVISADFGTVHPRADAFSDYTFLVGALIPCRLNLEATLRAENLPEPSTSSLVINITTRTKSLTVKDVIDYPLESEEW